VPTGLFDDIIAEKPASTGLYDDIVAEKPKSTGLYDDLISAPKAEPVYGEPGGETLTAKEAGEIEAGAQKAFPPPPRPGFFKELGTGLIEPVRATAGAGFELTHSDEDLKNHLLEQYNAAAREGEPTTAGKVGRFLGGTAGSIGEGLVAGATTGPTGIAGAFGAIGAYNAFVKAGTRAIAQGLDLDQALLIAKKAALVNAPVQAAVTFALPASRAVDWKEALRQGGRSALAGGAGQVVENVTEKALGLPTPLLEGVPQAALTMGGLPLASHALAQIPKLLKTPEPFQSSLPPMPEESVPPSTPAEAAPGAIPPKAPVPPFPANEIADAGLKVTFEQWEKMQDWQRDNVRQEIAARQQVAKEKAEAEAQRLAEQGKAPELTPAPAPAVAPTIPASVPIHATTPEGETPEPESISERVKTRLLAGETVSREDVHRHGQQAGLEQKQSEEHAEVGLVKAAKSIANGEGTDLEKYRQIVDLYNRAPNFTTRTVESKVNQAYSTPPPLAYLAGKLADLRSGKEVLEPTAGHGMLLIDAGDAKLRLNELDPKRAERLKSAFPEADVTERDAADPTLAHYSAEHDRVIANPPFRGRVGEEGGVQFPLKNAITAKKTTPSIDLAIAMNALHTLPEDGKAAIIIGSKTGTPSANFSLDPSARAQGYNRPEFLQLFKQFNVKDWFTVGGDLYNKMGAGWPVDVIVIDGKRPTAGSAEGGLVRPWIKPPQVYESWQQLESKLGQSSGEAGRGRGGILPEPSAGEPGRPGVSAPPLGRPEPRLGGGPEAGGVSGIEGARPVGTVSPAQPPDLGGRAGVARPAAPVGQAGAAASKPVAPALVEPGKPTVPSVRGEPGKLNAPYVARSTHADPKLVAPSNMAEPMRTALVALEKETGKPIDHYVAEKLGWNRDELFSRLNAAQIDSVGLAIRNIERGTALITGDQMGVGKGRQIASVIEYARKEGLIPIFVTAKKQLYTDMAGRDLPSVGNKDFKPFITDTAYEYTNGRGENVFSRESKKDVLTEIARTGELPAGHHGFFTTYEQLKSDAPAGYSETAKEAFKRKRRGEPKPDGPRLAAMRALADKAVFVMDESHLAAGTDSNLFLSLSSMLPAAKGAFFASATFAKRPDNMGLYVGSTQMRNAVGSDAKARQSFVEMMKRGGNPLQQALSSMLTRAGEFVRREQDWSGVKEFAFKQVTKDAALETEAADSYTSYLRDLMRLGELVNERRKSMADNENQVRAKEESVQVTPMTFGSRLFNLSNQYLLALKADAIADEAISVLKEGRKPFIALNNTMAGPIADLQVRKLPVNFGGILRREMSKMLEVTVKDPMHKEGSYKVTLKPEDLPDGGAFYRRLEDEIAATDFGAFPISPIDHIKGRITEAGFKIGEITGRDSEFTPDASGEMRTTKREKAERNTILHNYNHGQLHALIVNSAASTGLSAHTDPSFRDQGQRVMIVGQPAPDINTFMQMLGRIMRYGQTKNPAYRVLQSSLAAERRFMTMLRGKMASLNANTTADVESEMTGQKGFAEDIFNQIGDQVVYDVLEANPDLAKLADIKLPERSEEGVEGFARKATGLFVLLPNADAEHLWQQIGEHYADTIHALDEMGENPLRASVEDLQAKTLSSEQLIEGTGSGEFDGPANLERVSIKAPQSPFKHEEALAIAQRNQSAAEQRARDWMTQSRAAEAERIKTAEARGSTSEQLDKIRSGFQNARAAVQTALTRLGNTYGVDPTGGGEAGFHAVVVDLKLRGKEMADFSSPSKQQAVLAVNTPRRIMSLPLSKTEAEGTLSEADETHFDAAAESTTERNIITGNILRGYEQALKMSTETKPRIAIYTKADGSTELGVMLPAGIRTGELAGKRIQSPEQLGFALNNGKTVRAGEVEVLPSGEISLPASNDYKRIWGHPDFRDMIETGYTIQRGKKFYGKIRAGEAGRLFQLVQSAGHQWTEHATTAPAEAKEAASYSTAGPGPQSLGITPIRPSSFGSVINLFSGTGQAVKGWLGTMAGRSMPKTTLANREAGEAGVRYASSQVAAPYLAREMSEKVLGGLKIDPEKFGAALTENQLRGRRSSFLRQAADAAARGDMRESRKYSDMAAEVKTMVGRFGLFRDEAALQAYVHQPEVMEAARRHSVEQAARLDPIYQDAIDKGNLPPKPEVGSLFPGQVFANLFVPRDGGVPSRRTISVGSPKLTATFKGKTRFSLARTGASDRYGINYHDMIANSYAGMLEIANKNVFDQALRDSGLAVLDTPGQQIEIGGTRAVPFPYKRGSTIGIEGGEVEWGKSRAKDIYVRSDLAREYEIASNVYRNQFADTLGKMGMDIFNRINLAGLMEALYHTRNLTRALMGAPGKNIVTDSLLSALPGRPDVLARGFDFLQTAFRDNREKLAKIATIGAGRTEMPVTMNPATWTSGFINWFDRNTRVVLSDTYDKLAAQGLVARSETNKREFINRVGQYNNRLQGTWMNAFRKSGVGPYITAGRTFNVQGVKSVLLSPGVEATSLQNAAYLRANMAAKILGTMATIYVANQMISGTPFGRPGVPLGSIDTGKDDETGKPLHIPLLDQLTLVQRGARSTGVRGAVEAKRLGLNNQQAFDAAARDIVNSWLHPMAGPAVQYGVAATTGHAPAIGLPRKLPVVAPGHSQFLSDMKYAAGEVNPVVATLIPGMTPDSKPTMQERGVEAGKRTVQMFDTRAGMKPEAVEKAPEIIGLSQLHKYTEQLAADARKKAKEDRMDYVTERFDKDGLDDEYRAKALKQLKAKGVLKYE
jgi:hypothetical protein